MHSQNNAEGTRPDKSWVGTMVGAALWVVYVLLRPDVHPGNWSWGLILGLYAFIAVVGVLSNWGKEFFWSMTLSAAVIFGIWNLVLLLWH